jgi:hypothetical protein
MYFLNIKSQQCDNIYAGKCSLFFFQLIEKFSSLPPHIIHGTSKFLIIKTVFRQPRNPMDVLFWSKLLVV